MRCTLTDFTLRILAAYTRIREECCPAGGYPTLSSVRCMTEIIKQCYFNTVDMITDANCSVFTETVARPEAPAAGACQMGKEGWVESIALWLEGIQCVELGCWDLAEYYPFLYAVNAPNPPTCNCDSPWTYQQEQAARGMPITELIIGPYGSEVELYTQAGNGVSVLAYQDFIVGGTVYRKGEFVNGSYPCPLCNYTCVVSLEYQEIVIGRISANTSTLITVGTSQGYPGSPSTGWPIYATGTICVRKA